MRAARLAGPPPVRAELQCSGTDRMPYRARTSSGESLTGAGRSAVRVGAAAAGEGEPEFAALRARGARFFRPLGVRSLSSGGGPNEYMSIPMVEVVIASS